MNSFLTLEDINGCLYKNQNFFWHEINTANISDSKDFSNIKYDFCKVTRSTSGSTITYTVEIDNSYWTKGYYILDNTGAVISPTISLSTSTLTIATDKTSIRLFLYLGINSYDSLTLLSYKLKNGAVGLNYEELNTNQSVKVISISDGTEQTVTGSLTVGFNAISYNSNACGFLLVNLVRSDFQFTCNQELSVGKVNKVALGTNTKYKPEGAMIGTNTPNITVEYNNQIMPVTYDGTLEDYVFNLDLTAKQNEGNIRIKVNVEDNQVINATETYVTLHCSYESINTLTKLTNLFNRGGVGRITSNLTLTDNLTISNDVYLVSDGKTLTMDGHKLVVPSDKTFKANNLTFTGGTNTIQQNTNTKVELTNCTFSNCTGLGSVIDCQVDVNSLDDTTDFTTILTGCTFTNNDLCILHGGDLTITDCNVTGKISDKNYPYFLYQTDGTAVILQSQFNISSNSQIASDIEFNPCIFTCGETATINGHSHTELQGNNLTSFLTTQRNTSSIDLTYKYSLINDYIRLKSSNGFCHSCSGVDYVFKTNVTPERL